jgi:hypothetical protein
VTYKIESSDFDQRFARFLIIGESIESRFMLNKWDFLNVVVALSVLAIIVFVILLNPIYHIIWFIFLFALGATGIYYSVLSRKSQEFAITKYRLITVETYIILNKLFKSKSFTNFQDMHYEHVETIEYGYPKLNLNKFWTGTILIALAWVFFQSQDDLFPGESPLLPLIILFLLIGTINILSSLPLDRSVLKITSVSGKAHFIPSKKVPEVFLQNLIQNTRVFLSLGRD